MGAGLSDNEILRKDDNGKQWPRKERKRVSTENERGDSNKKIKSTRKLKLQIVVGRLTSQRGFYRDLSTFPLRKKILYKMKLK